MSGIRMLLVALALVAAGSLAIVVLRSVEQRLTYRPEREINRTPEALGLAFEEAWLQADDGERLHAWWIPGTVDATVLHCHGNGGNIGGWVDALPLLRGPGYSVLLFDYRGYGRSYGRPSEEGLARDARAAYDHVTRVRGVPPSRVVVWGTSLGAAVAARLVQAQPCAALVLEAGFTSLPDMAPRALPWLPLSRHLASARFDTRAAVSAIGVPKLFLHGARDEVVPLAMGEALHAAAAPPREIIVVEGAQHGDIADAGGPELAARVHAFIARALAATGGGATAGGTASEPR